MKRIALATLVVLLTGWATVPAAAFTQAQIGEKYVDEQENGYILLSLPAGEYTVDTDALGLSFFAHFCVHEIKNLPPGGTLNISNKCAGLYIIEETDGEGQKVKGGFSFTLMPKAQSSPGAVPDADEKDTPSDNQAAKASRTTFTGEPSATVSYVFFFSEGTWRIRNFQKVEYQITQFGTDEVCVHGSRPRKLVRSTTPACQGPLLLTVIEPSTDWRLRITKVR